MIFQEQTVPAGSLQLLLPAADDLLQLPQGQGRQIPFFPAGLLIQNQVLKLEHHRKLAAIRSTVLSGNGRSGAPGLPHRHQIRGCKCLPAHFPDVFVELRAVFQDLLIRDLAKQIHHIQPEASDAPVCPPADHGIQALAHFGIFPVEIRLLFGESVEVELFHFRHPFPGRAAKSRFQVIGRIVRLTIPPDVKIMPWILTALFGFPEPGVFIGGVAQHQIHDDADLPLLCLGDQFIHVGQGAEHGVNVLIIGNVVAVIILRGAEHRGKPNGIHPQLLQIVQFGNDTGNIPKAVAVAVAKAPGIDLIDYRILPPLIHSAALQLSGICKSYFSTESSTGASARKVMPSAFSGG